VERILSCSPFSHFLNQLEKEKENYIIFIFRKRRFLDNIQRERERKKKKKKNMHNRFGKPQSPFEG
jgi:hypothetical protein